MKLRVSFRNPWFFFSRSVWESLCVIRSKLGDDWNWPWNIFGMRVQEQSLIETAIHDKFWQMLCYSSLGWFGTISQKLMVVSDCIISLLFTIEVINGFPIVVPFRMHVAGRTFGRPAWPIRGAGERQFMGRGGFIQVCSPHDPLFGVSLPKMGNSPGSRIPLDKQKRSSWWKRYASDWAWESSRGRNWRMGICWVTPEWLCITITAKHMNKSKQINKVKEVSNQRTK